MSELLQTCGDVSKRAYRHFGLSDEPFHPTEAPRLLFLSAGHRESLAALEWGVLHEPSGFTVLVGETGTGKTTLVSSILARKYDRTRLVYVCNPKPGFEVILHELLLALGIQSAPDKLLMLNAFDSFLSSLSDGERIVLIVDEAQTLDEDGLDELRLFFNDGRVERRQLGLVLLGQPRLLWQLMQPDLRQFNDRVGARGVLNPLTREEAFDYIEYRLNMCGSAAARVFASGVLSYCITHGGGIPRRINTICRNAMLIAYAAHLTQIDLASARAAVVEYDNPLTTRSQFDQIVRWNRLLWMGGGLTSVLALGFLVTNLNAWRPHVPSPQMVAAAQLPPSPPITTTPIALASQTDPILLPVPAHAPDDSQNPSETRHSGTRHRHHLHKRRLQSRNTRVYAHKEHYSIWQSFIRNWFNRG